MQAQGAKGSAQMSRFQAEGWKEEPRCSEMQRQGDRWTGPGAQPLRPLTLVAPSPFPGDASDPQAPHIQRTQPDLMLPHSPHSLPPSQADAGRWRCTQGRSAPHSLGPVACELKQEHLSLSQTWPSRGTPSAPHAINSSLHRDMQPPGADPRHHHNGFGEGPSVLSQISTCGGARGQADGAPPAHPVYPDLRLHQGTNPAVPQQCCQPAALGYSGSWRPREHWGGEPSLSAPEHRPPTITTPNVITMGWQTAADSLGLGMAESRAPQPGLEHALPRGNQPSPYAPATEATPQTKPQATPQATLQATTQGLSRQAPCVMAPMLPPPPIPAPPNPPAEASSLPASSPLHPSPGAVGQWGPPGQAPGVPAAHVDASQPGFAPGPWVAVSQGVGISGLSRPVSKGRKTSSIWQLPDDGYQWHKYGQKMLMDRAISRAYFRCAQRNNGCSVKKTVDFPVGDSSRKLCITYDGDHNHMPDVPVGMLEHVVVCQRPPGVPSIASTNGFPNFSDPGNQNLGLTGLDPSDASRQVNGRQGAAMSGAMAVDQRQALRLGQSQEQHMLQAQSVGQAGKAQGWVQLGPCSVTWTACVTGQSEGVASETESGAALRQGQVVPLLQGQQPVPGQTQGPALGQTQGSALGQSQGPALGQIKVERGCTRVDVVDAPGFVYGGDGGKHDTMAWEVAAQHTQEELMGQDCNDGTKQEPEGSLDISQYPPEAQLFEQAHNFQQTPAFGVKEEAAIDWREVDMDVQRSYSPTTNRGMPVEHADNGGLPGWRKGSGTECPLPRTTMGIQEAGHGKRPKESWGEETAARLGSSYPGEKHCDPYLGVNHQEGQGFLAEAQCSGGMGAGGHGLNLLEKLGGSGNSKPETAGEGKVARATEDWRTFAHSQGLSLSFGNEGVRGVDKDRGGDTNRDRDRVRWKWNTPADTPPELLQDVVKVVKAESSSNSGGLGAGPRWEPGRHKNKTAIEQISRNKSSPVLSLRLDIVRGRDVFSKRTSFKDECTDENSPSENKSTDSMDLTLHL